MLKIYLQAFSGFSSVDEVKAIFNGAVNQKQNGEAWLRKVNMINADLEIELLYTGGRSRESLTTTDFNKFQSEDEAISRLTDLKNNGTNLNGAEKSKESKEVGGFLGDFEKFLSVKMMAYYTELQQKGHSSNQKIGAFSFYRITREHGSP